MLSNEMLVGGIITFPLKDGGQLDVHRSRYHHEFVLVMRYDSRSALVNQCGDAEHWPLAQLVAFRVVNLRRTQG